MPSRLQKYTWLVLGLASCAAPKDPINQSVRNTFQFESVPTEHTLGPGDLVHIQVLGHPDLATRDTGTRVDASGHVTLPLVDRVNLQGLPLHEARKTLEASFSEYVREPVATIDLLENGSNRYYILGHVHSPGPKPIDRPLTALEAASSGGYFLRGADRSHIFVLRPHDDGLESHLFDLNRPGPESLVQIQSGDVIFVRQTGVDDFQEDWLPILSSLGITALTLSNNGTFD